MAAPAQKKVLGTLFLFIGVAFAGVAWAALRAHQWVIVVAAIALCAWFLASGLRSLRPW